jgi:hypothetical protein
MNAACLNPGTGGYSIDDAMKYSNRLFDEAVCQLSHNLSCS